VKDYAEDPCVWNHPCRRLLTSFLTRICLDLIIIIIIIIRFTISGPRGVIILYSLRYPSAKYTPQSKPRSLISQ